MEPLLTVEGLSVGYGRPKSPTIAVDSVDLAVNHGEILGVVGESGSGKTSLARAILGLRRPTAGRVVLDGRVLTDLTPKQFRGVRDQLQVVFQDPQSSFDPRQTIGSALDETLRVHRRGDRRGRRSQILRLTESVCLDQDHLNRYPHQLSGGQCQRFAIARALILSPRLLICDEAVSALDVTVQAQILNLLKRLTQEIGFAMMFITHDINVVSFMADRIAVMRDGRVVESGPTTDVLRWPSHEYTRSLLSAVLEVPAPTPDLAGRVLAGASAA
jgi:ABC-type glutathione transport system ATPase component